MVSFVISFSDNINEHPSVVVIHDFGLGSNRLHIEQSIQGVWTAWSIPLKVFKGCLPQILLVHS